MLAMGSDFSSLLCESRFFQQINIMNMRASFVLVLMAAGAVVGECSPRGWPYTHSRHPHPH